MIGECEEDDEDEDKYGDEVSEARGRILSMAVR
jgi:hypothetical protein